MDNINTVTPNIEEDSERRVSDTIRPNSPTILIDESTSRFNSAIWANAVTEQTIILAGLGGIGSYVAYLLSRIKPKRLIMYDPDIVDATNMSGQFFTASQINQSKVSAIATHLEQFSGYYNTISKYQEFNIDSFATDIMICGFDNMTARKDFYTVWKSHVMDSVPRPDRAKCLFIDGRLAAEEFQVFCIKGDSMYHMDQYENNWLFNDEEAEATICSYKQTSHCANMIASIMVNLFVNFIANQCKPLIERDVPFMTSYDASTMYFKTIS